MACVSNITLAAINTITIDGKPIVNSVEPELHIQKRESSSERRTSDFIKFNSDQSVYTGNNIMSSALLGYALIKSME